MIMPRSTSGRITPLRDMCRRWLGYVPLKTHFRLMQPLSYPAIVRKMVNLDGQYVMRFVVQSLQVWPADRTIRAKRYRQLRRHLIG